jgi:hypothetical protein
LTSGAAKYWQQAYLFVAAHPYFTLTDSAGQFRLAQVPPGEYRLHFWFPNGKVVGRDRDPNFGTILRQRYAPPFERIQSIRVSPGVETRADMQMTSTRPGPP